MRLRLTAIERYVLLQTLTAVLGATAIIGSVVLLIDFVELSRQIGGRPEVNFLSIVQLTAMKSPSVIVVLLPFMFLFGTLAAFVGLNLFQSAFTGFCPLAKLLKAAGARPGLAFE